MIESAIAQGLFKLSLALTAIFMGWLFLRFLDKNSTFDEKINKYANAPIYYGLRFFGVMVVLGLILG